MSLEGIVQLTHGTKNRHTLSPEGTFGFVSKDGAVYAYIRSVTTFPFNDGSIVVQSSERTFPFPHPPAKQILQSSYGGRSAPVATQYVCAERLRILQTMDMYDDTWDAISRTANLAASLATTFGSRTNTYQNQADIIDVSVRKMTYEVFLNTVEDDYKGIVNDFQHFIEQNLDLHDIGRIQNHIQKMGNALTTIDRATEEMKRHINRMTSYTNPFHTGKLRSTRSTIHRVKNELETQIRA